jgi:hypothetical protein
VNRYLPSLSKTGCSRRILGNAQRQFIFFLSFLLLISKELLAADGFHAGPLFDGFPLTLTPGHRTEAFGPFFYSEFQDTRRTWALPPLFSSTWDPATDFQEVDFAYPLMTYRRFGTEHRWQTFQFLSFSGGRNQADQAARRFTLFPVYFQQRSVESNQNYTALLPLYGHLKNRLFRDEIFFVLFPLYGESTKKDVVTRNYLYPFFHLRQGDGLRGWQFWPVAGHEHKEVTLQTNGFGDTRVIGGHDSRFVLWPFFMTRQSGIGTETPQQELSLLPFYSGLHSPQRDSTTVLWPLITHVTDREQHYREWETPWPLIVFARGEGKTTTRIWPLFSHAQNTNLESGFFLWPLYKFNRMQSGPSDRKRTRILFFLYSDKILKNVETGDTRRRIDFWPLFTHSRDFDGATRLQVLSVLEPFLPNSPSVERVYSPVWSLWRAEHNPRAGAASQSLLWNLYRRDTTPQSTKTSALFGLFQFQSGAEGRGLRLFYVPVVKPRSAVPPHSP